VVARAFASLTPSRCAMELVQRHCPAIRRMCDFVRGTLRQQHQLAGVQLDGCAPRAAQVGLSLRNEVEH
jgi:hypothetical protein